MSNRRVLGTGGGSAFSSGGVTNNVIPKEDGVGGLKDSSITDNGTVISSAEPIQLGNGVVGTPSYSFTNFTNQGMWTSASGQVNISGNGAWMFGTASGATVAIQLRNGNALAWSSGTSPNLSNSTLLTSPGAANVQLGAADAAVPVAQTLQSQGSRGGTDSDTAGQSLTIQSGKGTGLAKPTALILSGSIYGTTGTTAHTVVKRHAFHVSAKTITNNTATTIVTSAAANSSSIGVMINYTVNCSDATNTQSETGTITVSGVANSSGTQTLAAVVKSANAQAVSSGTLAVTWTAVTNGATVDIKVASNSSLTPTTHTVHIEVTNLSAINDITLA